MSATVKRLMTIFGPQECGDDFIWDAHVHLWGRPYHSKDDPDLILLDEDMAVRELGLFYDRGGRVVVEFSPYDFMRDWKVLKAIAERTRVHILAGSGFYRSPGLDVFLKQTKDVDWRERMIQEVMHGEPETGIKPSFLKWSTSFKEITAAELASLDIVSDVHKKTGLPIATHAQRGTMAMEQVKLLKGKGIEPGKILIMHLDMLSDLTEKTYLEILKEGVNVSIDQLGKPKYGQDRKKITILKNLCELGYADKIQLATDIGRRSNFKCNGGSPGIEHIPAKIIPLLNEMKFSEGLIKQLVNKNPRDFYGIEA